MDDDLPTDWGYPSDGFFVRRSDWRFDLARAQRERNHPKNASPVLHEDRIEAVVRQVERLIGEYTGTAERVGARIDQAILWEIVEALKRASLGSQRPFVGLPDLTATERFLARSLYGEILEASELAPAAEEDATQLAPEEWWVCLEMVSDSISEKPEIHYDD